MTPDQQYFSAFIADLRKLKASREQELRQARESNRGALEPYLTGRKDELITILQIAEQVAADLKSKTY